MRTRAALALLFALVVAACGVKTDLLLPNGDNPPEDRNDPSRPPQPIGQ
jgi:predicted small lipoprotein YifL